MLFLIPSFFLISEKDPVLDAVDWEDEVVTDDVDEDEVALLLFGWCLRFPISNIASKFILGK